MLDGALSKKINKILDVFLSAAARMSVWVDYPDEDIEELDFSSLLIDYKNARNELEKLLLEFDAGQAISRC